MHLTLNALEYCKSEYKCTGRCEDAKGADEAAGLFAIADGVGMASYSDRWAKTLVNHFIAEPLVGDDDCEKIRWLQRARNKLVLPKDSPELSYYVRDALHKPTYATLLGAYFPAGEEDIGRDHVECQLVAAGDSCALHYRDGLLQSGFPFDTSSAFDRSPTTLSSMGRDECWKDFQFHKFTLQTNDVLILATDAVAEWLLYEENDPESTQAIRKDRFQTLVGQTESTWPGFIDALRVSERIQDDDSTVITITLLEPEGALPEQMKRHNQIKKRRHQEYDKATTSGPFPWFSFWCGKPERNFSDIALAYGSGAYFSDKKLNNKQEGINDTKEKFLAFQSILAELERFRNSSPQDPDRLKSLWHEHREILENESATKGLRQALHNLDILLETPVENS